MKKLIKPFLMLFTVMVLAAPACAASEAAIGETAPDFTLTDIDGQTHSLSDLRGKTVVLEWTNHKCPYVQKHYETGNMQKLQKQAAAQDVVWLTINTSAPGKQGHVSPEEARAIMDEAGAAQSAYLFDAEGVTGTAYGAQTTPHMYVINEEGTLVYKGAIDDNPSSRHETVEMANNYVIPAIEAARQGTMPEVTQTKPYGCSIKYETM